MVKTNITEVLKKKFALKDCSHIRPLGLVHFGQPQLQHAHSLETVSHTADN